MKNNTTQDRMAIRLNLGCGTDYKDGWVNTDINKKIKADIYFDLNNKFPFKDNYADEIMLIDVYEHVDDPLHLMNEIVRVLKHGGRAIIRSPFWNNEKAWAHPAHTKGALTFRTLTNKDIQKGYKVVEMNAIPTSVGKFLPKFLRKKLSYFISGIIDEIEFKIVKL